jgi:hypothetical protein
LTKTAAPAAPGTVSREAVPFRAAGPRDAPTIRPRDLPGKTRRQVADLADPDVLDATEKKIKAIKKEDVAL